MRRIGFFAAFLLLLALTTATAASFDVQAEDITSFTTEVSISVPDPPLAVGPYYMIDAPPHATLTTIEPTGQGGNEKAQFIFQSQSIETEDRPPTNNGDYYVVWRSGKLDSGVRFENQTATVHFFRTSGTGQLTAGLFSCTPGVALETITGEHCSLLAVGDSDGAAETIAIEMIDEVVPAGGELRLKMVNLTQDSASIQWGYKAQNRPARIEVTANP